MSEPIKPALSPEEWVTLDVARDAGTNFERDEHGGTVFMDGWCRPPHTHALAALALYGQPFGFTREMVDALRAICCDASIMHSDRCVGVGEYDEAAAKLALAESAVDRIAALLPPEAP